MFPCNVFLIPQFKIELIEVATVNMYVVLTDVTATVQQNLIKPDF